MIRHGFEYRAPHDLDEAIEILATAGNDCAVLGGGTWLIPNMTFAAHQPKIVLDPRHLGLASITELDAEVHHRRQGDVPCRAELSARAHPLAAARENVRADHRRHLDCRAGNDRRVSLLRKPVVGRARLFAGAARPTATSLNRGNKGDRRG